MNIHRQAGYKVYGLSSSEDGRIRYVGQTKNTLGRRIAGHRRHSRLRTNPVNKWISEVLNSEHKLQIEVLQDNAIFDISEIEWISFFKCICDDLFNEQSGGVNGGGHKRSEVTIAKMTESKKRDAPLYSKLTIENVQEIKSLLGVIPNRDIAEKFNISQSTVSMVKHGNRWSHIH